MVAERKEGSADAGGGGGIRRRWVLWERKEGPAVGVESKEGPAAKMKDGALPSRAADGGHEGRRTGASTALVTTVMVQSSEQKNVGGNGSANCCI